MTLAERRGETCDHRERGRDRGDLQAAGEPVAQFVDFGAHSARVADDAARPVQHLLAFGREAAEARTAADQQNTHLLLDLLHPGRKSWLGHAASFGGAAEMAFAGQRKKEFEFIDQCVSLWQ